MLCIPMLVLTTIVITTHKQHKWKYLKCTLCPNINKEISFFLNSFLSLSYSTSFQMWNDVMACLIVITNVFKCFYQNNYLFNHQITIYLYMQDEHDPLVWKNKYFSTFLGSTKKIIKCWNSRKLRSFSLNFKKNIVHSSKNFIGFKKL